MFFTTFASALLLAASVRATGDGTILSPASGTAIAPGQSFSFNYQSAADYCKTSYGFQVYINTRNPTDYSQTTNHSTGTYLGFYQFSGSPNPYGGSPPPATFTMPDFSKGFGGFGQGVNVTNAPVWLVVSELYQGCTASFGPTFNLHYNQLIYNPSNSTGGGGGGGGGNNGTALPPPSPNYQIHPNGDNNWCLVTDSYANNVQAVLRPCQGSTQRWAIRRGNTYVLTNGNFSLDASTNPQNGTPVRILQYFAGYKSQQWYYTDDQRIAPTGSGKCLDLPNGSKTNGAPVQLYTCTTNNRNQVWTVTS